MERVEDIQNSDFAKDRMTILAEKLTDLIGPVSVRKERLKTIRNFFELYLEPKPLITLEKEREPKRGGARIAELAMKFKLQGLSPDEEQELRELAQETRESSCQYPSIW